MLDNNKSWHKSHYDNSRFLADLRIVAGSSGKLDLDQEVLWIVARWTQLEGKGREGRGPATTTTTTTTRRWFRYWHSLFNWSDINCCITMALQKKLWNVYSIPTWKKLQMCQDVSQISTGNLAYVPRHLSFHCHRHSVEAKPGSSTTWFYLHVRYVLWWY